MKQGVTHILPTLSVCLLKVLSGRNAGTFGIFIIYIHMENSNYISIYHCDSKISPELTHNFSFRSDITWNIYMFSTRA